MSQANESIKIKGLLGLSAVLIFAGLKTAPKFSVLVNRECLSIESLGEEEKELTICRRHGPLSPLPWEFSIEFNLQRYAQHGPNDYDHS